MTSFNSLASRFHLDCETLQIASPKDLAVTISCLAPGDTNGPISALDQDKIRGEHSTYLSKHPEVSLLVDGFVGAILEEKPSDVFAFAQWYFAADENRYADKFTNCRIHSERLTCDS